MRIRIKHIPADGDHLGWGDREFLCAVCKQKSKFRDMVVLAGARTVHLACEEKRINDDDRARKGLKRIGLWQAYNLPEEHRQLIDIWLERERHGQEFKRPDDVPEKLRRYLPEVIAEQDRKLDPVLVEKRARKRELRSRYYAANRESEIARTKKWRESNREREKDRRAKYIEANKEMLKDKRAERRAANKDKVNARSALYRAANLEKFNECRRKYYEANKERILIKQAQSRAANKDKVKARSALYRATNREKLNEAQKKRYALKRLAKAVEPGTGAEIKENDHDHKKETV